MTRYFIERRNGVNDYSAIGAQPCEGFSSVRRACEWLAARGQIERRLVEGKPTWIGVGGDRGYYFRPVPTRAGVGMDPELTLIDTRPEFEPLRIPALVRTPPAWRKLLNGLKRPLEREA